MTKIALVLIPVFLFAQAQAPPAAEEQARIVAEVRQHAMRFDGHLPDFLCVKITSRAVDTTGTGERFKQGDVLEERLSFSRGRTSYVLASINHKKTKTKHDKLKGLTEDDFLSGALVPKYIFGVRAPVKFQWLRYEATDRDAAHVFSFQVAPSFVNYPDGKTPFLLGMHGLIWVSTEGNEVLRIESTDDAPRNYPFRSSGSNIEYANVDIAGRVYLLPVRAMVFVLHAASNTLSRNTIEFTSYRKFETGANIMFESPTQ